MPLLLMNGLHWLGIVALVVFVALFVMYTLARMSPAAGEILAHTFATLVHWFVRAELAFKGVQKYLSTQWTDDLTEYTGWINGLTGVKIVRGKVGVTLYILFRMGWLIVTAGLLLGEGYNLVAAIPALFKVAYSNVSPFVFTISSTSLFLCPGILFGGAFLETTSIVHTYLFEYHNRILRIFMALVAFAGFAMSVIASYEFFNYRAYYLDPTLRQYIPPLYIAGLTVNIFILIGLVAAVAIGLSWHALLAGIGVVLTLLKGIGSLVSGIVTFIISLIPRFIERVTLTLSQGTISPYKDPTSIDKEKEEPQTSLVLASLGGPTMPFRNQQLISVLFGGPFGSEAFAPFTNRFNLASGVIHTTGLLDLTGDPGQQNPSKIYGAENISPDAGARAIYQGLTPAQSYSKLFKDMGNSQVNHHLNSAPSVLLYVLDIMVISYAKEMLEEVHRQLPQHYLLVVTAASQRNLTNPLVRNNLRLLETLYMDGVLASSILIDSTSPFSADEPERHGEHIQLEFAAHAIMGLVTAHKHTGAGWTNKTAMHVLSRIPGDCPFLSLSFASTNVAPGEPPRYAWFWGLFTSKKDKLVKPNVGHAIVQAEAITKRVTAEHTGTRALWVPITQSNHGILLYHVPIQIGSDFTQFSIGVRRLFEIGVSHFQIMTLASRGMWYIEEKMPQWILQVTCLYPFKMESILPATLSIEAPAHLTLFPPSSVPAQDTQQVQSGNAAEQQAEEKTAGPARPLSLPTLPVQAVGAADTSGANGHIPTPVAQDDSSKAASGEE